MPTQVRPVPNASAASGDTTARGNGRSRVRSISASASRSRYMLSVFDAATSSAVPIRVMIVRQWAMSPGASHRPPRKVITTMPVMRGLPRLTMLLNQVALTRPGTVSGSARSATSTCVASSAVATPRCASTVARARKLVTARTPSAICTQTSTGARTASARRSRRGPALAQRHDRRREHQQRHRDAGQPVQRLDQHGRVRVGPQRSPAQRDVRAGERRSRVADQAAQHHLEEDRDRRHQRHPRHRRRRDGLASESVPAATAPRRTAASGRTAATSRCARSRRAWAGAG